MDSAGNVRVGVAVTLNIAGTGTAATHYSALTGGTSTTGSLVTGSDGTIVDGSGNRRYVDEGVSLDLTIAGRSRRIEPISAAVARKVAGIAAVVDLPTGVFATDRAAIQAQLDVAHAAGGGYVKVPPGEYGLDQGLLIYSNTTLELDPQTTIKRQGNFDNMLRNGADGVTGGYTANDDIAITGGTWDGNAANFASNVCMIAFGHCSRVTISDATFKNCYGYHEAELNAVKTGRVLNCNFLDYTLLATGKELLQIDLADSVGAFPWFGPFDKTPCDDILVQGNRFENGPTALGSHTVSVGFKHRNIRVIGNSIKTMSEKGIVTNGWDNVLIEGNTIEAATSAGIFCSPGVENNYDYVITGNRIYNITDAASARGIYLISTTTNRIVRALIANNVIRGSARYGVTTDNSQNVILNDNHVTESGLTGVYIVANVGAVMNGNIVRGNNVLAAGGHYDSILGQSAAPTTDSQHVVVEGNVFDTLRLDYIDRLLLKGNVITTTYGDNARGGDVRAEDNLFPSGMTRSVASAGTVTLPSHLRYVNITGTTGITAITASWADRLVVLRFAGALTVTDGSNLLLNGNFVTTADDTLTLVSDGTNWIEMARSVN